MQLQFQKSILQYLTQGMQEVKNEEVTQEIRLGEGMPDVGRILATWEQCLLRSKQWQGDEIEVSGGVKTWTLYLPEDGTEPRVLEGWLPFQQRWNVPSDGKTGVISLQPQIRYADSRSISSRKIMLRVGIGTLCRTFLPTETEVYQPGELPGDLAVLQRSYPIRLPVEAGEKTFLLDEEVQLPLTGTDWKILWATVNPEVTEQRIASDKVVFKGHGNLQMLCRNGDGDIRSVSLELPFAQFAQLDGTWGNGCYADVSILVTDLETDLQESGQIRIKCSLVGQYLVDQEQSITVAEDAYCPRRQIQAEWKQLQLPTVLEEKVEKVAVEAVLPGQSGQVISCSCLPDHPRKRQTADDICLELSGQMQILFYGSEGMLQGGTARWETHREIPADGGCRMTVRIQPDESGVTAVHGDQIGGSGQLQMQLRTQCLTDIPMIVGIEFAQAEESLEHVPSLILRRCGQKTLWEIAKECKSTVDAIVQANHLDGEPVEDQMLLIPVV